MTATPAPRNKTITLNEEEAKNLLVELGNYFKDSDEE